jgi:hypothetical protein
VQHRKVGDKDDKHFQKLERINTLTADVSAFSDVPELMYSIANSNLPALEMFDFLINNGITRHKLVDVLCNDFKKNLNYFCAALMLLMSDEETPKLTERDVQNRLYVLSRQYQRESDIKINMIKKPIKSTEQLVQELLDVL